MSTDISHVAVQVCNRCKGTGRGLDIFVQCAQCKRILEYGEKKFKEGQGSMGEECRLWCREGPPGMLPWFCEVHMVEFSAPVREETTTCPVSKGHVNEEPKYPHYQREEE